MVSPIDASDSPTGRKLGRPADTDSIDTRDRIILCACTKFAGEGFDGTTNKEIASLAGVSSAALYHYFPSKADLYVAVCEYLTSVFDGVFQRARDFDPRLERRMTALLAENGKIGDETPFIVGFVTGISSVLKKHPEVARGANAFNDTFRRMTLELIETSTEKDGIISGGSDSGFADLTVSALAGFGRMSARGDHVRRAAAGEMYLRLIRAAAHK
jgi:AcrR family transcriptional regulator